MVVSTAVILMGVGHDSASAKKSESHFDPNPSVDTIFQRACADCHSDSTHWPWYGRTPPLSWLIQRDVQQARAHLDLSAKPGIDGGEREEVLDAVSDGSMPPRLYLLMHPAARLSPRDLEILGEWVREPGPSGGRL